MAVSSLRYTIDLVEGTKKLLSVALRPSGDLIVDFKPAPRDRANPNTTELTDTVRSARTSVHPSRDSLTHNTITRTTTFVTGKPRRSVQVTAAIKTTNQFAPLSFRHFPDLRSEEMQLAAPGPQAISLGLLDAANFNLVMGVFVGARDRIFDPRAVVGPYTNITQNKVGEFNLVLLHTFFRAPSIQHGNMAYIYTNRPDTLTDPVNIAHNRQLMDGFDERHASRLFSEMAMRFEGMYWDLKPPDTKMPDGWSLKGTLGD